MLHFLLLLTPHHQEAEGSTGALFPRKDALVHTTAMGNKENCAEVSKADLGKGQEAAASRQEGCCVPGSPGVKAITGFVVVERTSYVLCRSIGCQ